MTRSAAFTAAVSSPGQAAGGNRSNGRPVTNAAHLMLNIQLTGFSASGEQLATNLTFVELAAPEPKVRRGRHRPQQCRESGSVYALCCALVATTIWESRQVCWRTKVFPCPLCLLAGHDGIPRGSRQRPDTLAEPVVRKPHRRRVSPQSRRLWRKRAAGVAVPGAAAAPCALARLAAHPLAQGLPGWLSQRPRNRDRGAGTRGEPLRTVGLFHGSCPSHLANARCWSCTGTRSLGLMLIRQYPCAGCCGHASHSQLRQPPALGAQIRRPHCHRHVGRRRRPGPRLRRRGLAAGAALVSAAAAAAGQSARARTVWQPHPGAELANGIRKLCPAVGPLQVRIYASRLATHARRH